MVEVKPYKQTLPPVRPQGKDKRKIKRFIEESVTYAVNQAKWEAAEDYCFKRGWKFVKMTEKELGI